MGMKIEGNRPSLQTDSTSRLDSSRKAERVGSERPAGKGDRVEVSQDAQLMTAALKAATTAPGIRQDAVDRARKALDAGQVGQDSGALADKLIDDLLKG